MRKRNKQVLRTIFTALCCVILGLQGRSQNQIQISEAREEGQFANAAIICQMTEGKHFFRENPTGDVNFKLTGNEFHFIILKLSCSGPSLKRLISISNTSIDTVIYYSLQNNLVRKIYEGGRLIPFTGSKSFVWHVAPFTISEQPSYLVIALKAIQKNINLKYVISDEAALQDDYIRNDRVIFFYAGIAFMISAIILLAWFLFRNRAFALYFGYMMCVSCWILDHYNVLFPMLYPNIPELNKIVKPLSSLGAALLLLTTQKFIFMRFLKSDRKLLELISRIQKLLLIILGCMVFMLAPDLNSVVSALLIALWHSGLIISVAVIAFQPFYFIHTGKVARIFSVAMLVICVFTLEQLFANLGWINFRLINEHGMALGSLTENSIMAFGLLYGLMIERRAKDLRLLAMEEEQKDMLEKLIFVQRKERAKIAGDLHDNIGPLLAALKINFRRIIKMNNIQNHKQLVEKTEAILDDSINEIRNVAHNLMPKDLASKGLISTLTEYFNNVQQLYGKQLTFSHKVHCPFTPELQLNIYFIICELVLNAARHSNAQKIEITIITEPCTVSIQIADNGIGFETMPDNSSGSLGLKSAESRIQFLKGKLAFKSETGKGTKFMINLPL